MFSASCAFYLNFSCLMFVQEFSSKYSVSDMGINGSSVAVEKSRSDDSSASKSRGWLNWLSLGVLGAGGTDDSSQFSGVVSDEVIKVHVPIEC